MTRMKWPSLKLPCPDCWWVQWPRLTLSICSLLAKSTCWWLGLHLFLVSYLIPAPVLKPRTQPCGRLLMCWLGPWSPHTVLFCSCHSCVQTWDAVPTLPTRVGALNSLSSVFGWLVFGIWADILLVLSMDYLSSAGNTDFLPVGSREVPEYWNDYFCLETQLFNPRGTVPTDRMGFSDFK